MAAQPTSPIEGGPCPTLSLGVGTNEAVGGSSAAAASAHAPTRRAPTRVLHVKIRRADAALLTLEAVSDLASSFGEVESVRVDGAKVCMHAVVPGLACPALAPCVSFTLQALFVRLDRGTGC